MHTVFSDGGSRGNPGNAASAYLIFNKDNELVDFGSEFLGKETNNVAEYIGLINALKSAKKLKIKKLLCKLDSELVVKQINGIYKVSSENVKPLHAELAKLKASFSEITFTHIPREENKFADKLVNLVLDGVEQKKI